MLLALLKLETSLVTGLLLHNWGSLDIYKANDIRPVNLSQIMSVTGMHDPVFTVIISAADSMIIIVSTRCQLQPLQT